jgi:GntR family transcriptional regulator
VITTKRAYEELEKEGFIDTVEGKGSFVAMQNKELLREKKMKLVEEKLAGAVEEAKLLGIGLAELREMLALLHGEKE